MDHAQTPQLGDLIQAVENHGTDSGPLERLTDSVILAANLQEIADDLVGHFVDRARSVGISWAEIGDRLGITKQGAQKRFASRRPKKGTRRGFFTARFTDEARAVVNRAQRCARDRRNDHVGTEHLVVALIEDTKGFAARAVEASGGVLEPILNAAIASMDEGPTANGRGHIPFAADTKKVLELALRESLVSGDRRIATEHVLLGILRDKNSPGARLLTANGVDRGKATAWIEQHHSDASA